MIGIDIEKVERFKAFNKTKLNRIFTKNEIDYVFKFENPTIHIAGIWCAKEATIKCLKNKNIPLKKIEILHEENGAPYINLTPSFEEFLIPNNCSFIDVSISHTDDDACAVVEIY